MVREPRIRQYYSNKSRIGALTCVGPIMVKRNKISCLVNYGFPLTKQETLFLLVSLDQNDCLVLRFN